MAGMRVTDFPPRVSFRPVHVAITLTAGICGQSMSTGRGSIRSLFSRDLVREHSRSGWVTPCASSFHRLFSGQKGPDAGHEPLRPCGCDVCLNPSKGLCASIFWACARCFSWISQRHRNVIVTRTSMKCACGVQHPMYCLVFSHLRLTRVIAITPSQA